ncbi:hypothetical protein E0Z10_g8732 [Xylaria hypoxylon]|uniref:Uncharacterized protein n=1 Tax=Xylaria hypoxylon TaxID=37992 RepID=A0A4Z0Y881_9PEZI|nr:hypothetical protein E0Z10_g8732 [Xylaria hypoxylon]
MAQKTSDSDDPPNPSSSSTKEFPGPAAAQKQSTSHTSSPAPAAPNAHTPTPQSSFSTTTTTTKPLDSKQSGENAVNANTQPMSKSNSAASNPSSKDAMAGPSPYGTRSRNRGQTRPNYAEDRDLDVEMEDAPPEKKEEEPKKGMRQANAATNGTGDANKTTTSSSRKGAAADDSRATSSHGTSKDAHSTAPATANATGPATSSGPSKKRKATTQATTNNVHSQASTPTPTPTTLVVTGTRRSAAQPAAHAGTGYRETNMLSFEKCGGIPKDGKMVADDGTVLEPNDHVYLVCEPPGEPYYLGRIMEFLHVQNDSKKPVDALKINWYYRPKDIGKRVNDTRLVFATMHSDISPLTSLRGKCQIRHKAEIDDMDAYRKTPDRFWYEKLYDRYIQKHYDVIPCFQIVNVPEKVKKVLDERWKYILVEQGRGKEYTSAVKLCKRCNGYCASNDSVDCAVCQQTYHMNCVRPPLLKKPSRGFAWACAACSRAQERKLEARHTPSLLDSHLEEGEEELWDEEEDAIGTNRTSPTDGIDDSHQPATPEQIYQASLWPYRYLGQHCKPEDALDYDDRIYPRAGSRLGPKHQATVIPWAGRPVELVKPIETKRGGKKDGKSSKDALAAAAEIERVRREKCPWIQDEPPGYVPRGEDFDNDDPDNTAQLLWKPCDDTVIVPYAGFPKSKYANNTTLAESRINNYLQSAKAKMVPVLGLPKESTNFLDVAINTLFKSDFETDAALRALYRTEKSAFKEPELSAAEIKKFEEGVSKFGSELYLVTRHINIKTVKHARIVRFYYAWKKTDRGKQIWGNFSGRKGKKEARKAEADASKLQDDVANDHDDSAFDTDKALERKRSFMCKFCSTKSSRQWRRAPNSASTIISENGGKGAHKEKIQYIVALCRRCAELWRRYAIQWEDMEDLAKKVASAGGRSWKRRVDEELLKELRAAEEIMNMTVYSTPTRASPVARATPPAASNQPAITDQPPRKKLKTIGDKHAEQNGGDAIGSVPAPPPKKKEKPVEKPPPPPPPPAPELPKLRALPCAVCNQGSIAGEQVICCRQCRLTVHRSCYGIPDNRNKDKWTCDMCVNDKVPQVSIAYKCVLCPIDRTEHDFVEPPKNTHKKKTEKDREKERVDRELALKAVELYQKRQVELRRPVNPREPLKRTTDNNWVHVTCAVWTAEVKFSRAKDLCLSEGIPSIPRTKYEEACKVCKEKAGACVSCHYCRAPVHVECAHKSGYLLGFEITPVKGSRRDQHSIVTIGGETGSMSALIWCKEHIPQKTVVHRMHDIVKAEDDQSSDANALQLYVRNFKQADLALTGTVRKANLVNVVTKTSATTLPANQNRRHSSTTVPSPMALQRIPWLDADTIAILHNTSEKACITCNIDVSPRWHEINESQEKILTNGYTGTVGDEAQKFLAQRHFQCHKCKRDGRQPVPHVPPPVETPAAIEPVRPPPVINPSVAPNSPHHASHAITRMADLGTPWGQRVAPTQPPAPLGQTPLHGPPQPLPLTAPRAVPSPIAAPGPPPPSTHTYPTPGSSYNEWQRSSVQPPVTAHPISGSSSGPNSIHHNHLRDLRPPPITSIPHHQVGPIQHGLGQPMVNGVPPSSPRRGPPAVHNSGASFVTPYPPTHPPPIHSLTNGGPPPRTSDQFAGLLSQRPPFSTTPHRSPPVSRDGIPMNHEPSMNSNNSNNPPARPNDGRPANGASASPSLRNLLI